MRAITRRKFCSWLALAGLVPAAALAQPAEVSFGIVPQQSAGELARVWIPLLQETAARAGVRIVFRTAPDIPAFEERLKRGEYDFAYMNPYHYTVFSKAPGYRAFAREKDRRLVGIIVVPKDSPVSDIRQLAGKTVVFPAPAAFAASILPRAEFSRQNIPIEAKYVKSHDSVYLGVAQGNYAAGGGIRRTLEAIDPAVSARLRVLTSTPAYVPHAFAAHPRLAPETVSSVRNALVSLAGDDSGRKLLQGLSFKGVDPASDGEWDEIRRLGIRHQIGNSP